MQSKSLKYLLGLAMCATMTAYAANSDQYIKASIMMKTTHGVVQSGTWFNLALQDSIAPEQGSQSFTAKLIDPIYNEDFSEVLIPANSKVTGTYKNNGSSCSFEVENISYNNTRTRVLDVGGTDIELQPGAYSTINASLPNQPECNPKIGYQAHQLLEFQTKVDIAGLDPVARNADYVAEDKPDNFVQAYGNSDYTIVGITRFTNGLMQVSVKFNDESIKNKLVPVYYDEFGIPHPLNYTFIATEAMPSSNNIKSYLVLSRYNNFGFGILE